MWWWEMPIDSPHPDHLTMINLILVLRELEREGGEGKGFKLNEGWLRWGKWYTDSHELTFISTLFIHFQQSNFVFIASVVLIEKTNAGNEDSTIFHHIQTLKLFSSLVPKQTYNYILRNKCPQVYNPQVIFTIEHWNVLILPLIA